MANRGARTMSLASSLRRVIGLGCCWLAIGACGLIERDTVDDKVFRDLVAFHVGRIICALANDGLYCTTDMRRPARSLRRIDSPVYRGLLSDATDIELIGLIDLTPTGAAVLAVRGYGNEGWLIYLPLFAPVGAGDLYGAIPLPGPVTRLMRSYSADAFCWQRGPGRPWCAVRPGIEDLETRVLGVESVSAPVAVPDQQFDAPVVHEPTEWGFPVTWAAGAVDVQPPCALFADGTVKCWTSGTIVQLPVTDVTGIVSKYDGENSFNGSFVTAAGRVAYVGTVPTVIAPWAVTDLSAPVTAPRFVAGITDAVDLEQSAATACVVHASGDVSCWGVMDGEFLEPGEFVTAPVRLDDVKDAVQVVLPYQTGNASDLCWLRRDGKVRCREKELGDW
ncbi:MAG: hypothetical protein D6761_09535 [Candidatus Dadabacteria bacterium]|nr:MAG: hypothetical protein D6761_09535 [Candidatus Dadabacteria bacterium]